MRAKNHLNNIYIGGSLAFAAVAGIATGSLAVFGCAFVAALAIHSASGNIRI